MKKFFVAVLALVSMGAMAANLETKTSFASVQDSTNQGMVYGLAYTADVFEGTGFVKNVKVGGLVDFGMFENKMYDLFVAPVVKVEIPLVFAKAGFGHDFYKQAGVTTNGWALFIGSGVQTNLTDTVKVAFDYTMKYNIETKTYVHMFGPSFSFAL